MKNINKYLLIVSSLVLLLVTGCEDWLTIEPQNKVVKEKFWKTQQDVELVVASTFNKTRDFIDEEFLWGEIRADFFVPGDRIKDYYLKIMEGNIFPDNKFVKWNDYYKVINQANLVLDNAPAVRELDLKFDEEELNVILGQMLFLRSYCFFKLAITFKDIPMPLEAYEYDYQDFQISQTPQADVFRQVIIDMQEAEKLLPEEYINENDYSLKKGYPSRYAAKALMADTYIWLNEPQFAIEKCDEILTSGKFSLMGMTLWFDIFLKGESNESIFEIFSKSSWGETNRANDAEYSLKKLSSNGTLGSARFFAVSKNMYDMFTKDQRGVLRTVALSPNENGCTLWKYYGSSEVSPRDYGGIDDKNWNIYRLAQIYLMKAEAAIMLDDYTTARTAINVIRTRAEATPVSLSDNAGKYEWYKLLLQEFLLEHAGEGKRWYSMVRIASKDNYAYDNLLIEPIMKNIGLDVKVLMQSKIGNPDFWYLPIHEDEMRVNENLVQNEFYRTY